VAFTVKKRDSYRWTVEHTIAVRAGKPEVMTFDAEFKALGKKAIEDLMERARKGAVQDGEMLDQTLLEIHDLVDENSKPYTKADLEALCEVYPGLLGSIAEAWTRSVVGGAAARKN
jgi:hypothetical protein